MGWETDADLAEERQREADEALALVSEGVVRVGDLEQLIADTESKTDDRQLNPRALLEDLLQRLRFVAGLSIAEVPSDEERYAWPMTIGRTDVCLIKAPHDVTLCGKREAHR